jgi:CIC family chloride channel protein
MSLNLDKKIYLRALSLISRKKIKNTLSLSIKTRYIESEIFRYLSHILISIIIGLLAGAGGIFFHTLLEFTKNKFHPENLQSSININPIIIFFIPSLGALITSYMTYLFPEIAREKGVLSVIKAILIKKGYIPFKETLFHFFAPIISIGTGAPLGPEGPSAKIGGGIGSYISTLLKLNSNDIIMYTSAGGGAAISAVFNAPIAGVFFGIEVILLNDLKNRALSALIISSVVADILARHALGDKKVFVIPHYDLGDYNSYFLFFLLSIICGIISLFYFKLSFTFKQMFNEKLKITTPFGRLIPVTLVFGFFLLWDYDLFGIGYDTINNLFINKFSLMEALKLLILKICFLALFIQAGAFGGTFAPSLSIGAFAGSSFALLANKFFYTSIDPVAFGLVGMGGVLAGINSIPLTSILLVFEVTGDYKFILPLMLSSIISYLVIIYYRGGSEYSIALMDENIDVSKKGDIDVLSKAPVSSIIKKDMDIVKAKTSFNILINTIISAKYGDIIVINDKEQFLGIITLKDVRQALLDNDLADLLIASDLAVKLPAVQPQDSISTAIKIMKEYDLENVPVVNRANGKLEGIVTHRDIIEKYFSIVDDIALSEHLIKSEKAK